MSELMATRGVLTSMKQSKTSGDLVIQITVPYEMANQAHTALGGCIDPSKSRHVGLAVINMENNSCN